MAWPQTPAVRPGARHAPSLGLAARSPSRPPPATSCKPRGGEPQSMLHRCLPLLPSEGLISRLQGRVVRIEVANPRGPQRTRGPAPCCVSPSMYISHAPSPRAHVTLPASLPFLSPDSLGLVVHSDPRAFPGGLFPAFVFFKFTHQPFRSQQHLAGPCPPSAQRPSVLPPADLSFWPVPRGDPRVSPGRASGGGQ